MNDAKLKQVAAQDHYNKLIITLDQVKADRDAADNEVSMRNSELLAALKTESDLRATVGDLNTADETFEMAKAAAEVDLAKAKANYANEIAKIKKRAADRDMKSFGP